MIKLNFLLIMMITILTVSISIQIIYNIQRARISGTSLITSNGAMGIIIHFHHLMA